MAIPNTGNVIMLCCEEGQARCRCEWTTAKLKPSERKLRHGWDHQSINQYNLAKKRVRITTILQVRDRDRLGCYSMHRRR